jgi:hypothetical protein
LVSQFFAGKRHGNGSYFGNDGHNYFGYRHNFLYFLQHDKNLNLFFNSDFFDDKWHGKGDSFTKKGTNYSGYQLTHLYFL